jgi:diacylglycerol O-acyltransferase-1
MLFAVQQYILPTLALSVDDMKEKNFIKISEIISRLSIPNTYVWLLMFYTFFHLWLNLLAELTRFGDRLFYKDWFV